ncbi:hypothetical protein [Cellvibrio sp. PSBB006]|uniref:hypothetical protein n=1 Tax=Cellvibrio sp. PSBB006 TaxID=1987723 RepID=UPI000B3B1B8C|nr:hypothetical protein [Cellvibrio sp. PSBB006]ARU28775.1 hypothetical protein CBR65_15750 [Cellvibrio sp. PSBB006]
MLRLLVVAAVSTFLLIPIAGYSSNIIKNEILLIIASFISGYVIVPAILLKLWPERQGRNEVETLDSALESGLIKTVEYSVDQVVEIEEFEDEGLHYLMSISPNKTLSLFGQYLYPYGELENFPSTRIRLFIHTGNNLCYGIECAGDKITEIDQLGPPTPDAWAAGVVPYDLEIIEKPLVDIVYGIKKYA